MGKMLLVANQKGKVGRNSNQRKSLDWSCKREGKKVLMTDSDPQG